MSWYDTHLGMCWFFSHTIEWLHPTSLTSPINLIPCGPMYCHAGASTSSSRHRQRPAGSWVKNRMALGGHIMVFNLHGVRQKAYDTLPTSQTAETYIRIFALMIADLYAPNLRIGQYSWLVSTNNPYWQDCVNQSKACWVLAEPTCRKCASWPVQMCTMVFNRLCCQRLAHSGRVVCTNPIKNAIFISGCILSTE